jgi:superfamily II DNA or RNA helicase
MGTYQLRDYQTDLLDRVSESRGSRNRSIIIQLPTGGGKTICFSHVVAEANAKGQKALILAHREELIKQTADKIAPIAGIEPGIIKAGYNVDYSRAIQVASVQSLTRRLTKCPHFDLIVVDEAHHSTAKSYRSILNHFGNSQVLGVSATPVRLDGGGFRDLFDDLICGATVKQLIEMGSLSQYKYYAPVQSMSLCGVKKRGGDYRQDRIEAANSSALVAADCLQAYRDYLDGKQVVIFAVSVAHSQAIACSFTVNGIRATHLDGASDSLTRSLTIGYGRWMGFNRSRDRSPRSCNAEQTGRLRR